VTSGLRIGGARGAKIRFSFEGRDIDAFAGETIATALLANGISAFSRNQADGSLRGMFCAMGVCQECAVMIGGRIQEACRTVALPDMDVRMPS
jgi:D-hydroxyproline dehydrogenase subunit gamma